MAEAKTKPTKQSVKDFIGKLPDEQSRADCTVITKLMEDATKQKGVMWGTNIAGFGATTIKYAGGKEADWPLIAFSPRKQSLTFYISASDRPLSANEDWSGALLGLNPAHERFLPREHRALNGRGQLVDRWGAPLFFHSVARGQYAIRSAGPDGKLWTDDDIQRNPDGSFSYGPSLERRAP